MAANDNRAARILSDLCGALRRDKNIQEFGFIYCPKPLFNKSPVVVAESNLGLETWCLKLLYTHIHSQLFSADRRSLDLKQLNEYSMAVVLLNPDCLTAWNLRKQLVEKRYLKAEAELHFAKLVLSKHPKSPETFSQRRWLLQQLHRMPRCHQTAVSLRNRPPCAANPPNGMDLANERLQDEHPLGDDVGEAVMMSQAQSEMEVCTVAANRYPSNYNAWSHRIWSIKWLAGSVPEFCQSELKSTKSWVSVHISDHSGFQYRQFLLTSLVGLSDLAPAPTAVTDDGTSAALLLEELQLILDLVLSYPGHDAIWCHRRFVVHMWNALLCPHRVLTESDWISVNQGALCTTVTASTNGYMDEGPAVHQSFDEDEPLLGPTCNRHRGHERDVYGNHANHRGPESLRLDAELGFISSTPDRNAVKDQAPDEAAAFVRKKPPPFAMQLPSKCSHDASLMYPLEYLSAQDRLYATECPVSVDNSSPPRGLSCGSDDALSSDDTLRLIQHEKRFVDIVVEATVFADKAAQRRCGDSYCNWLESLAHR